jgi:hypothetical protein
MMEHRCKDEWKPGGSLECGTCHPPKPKTPGQLRSGYKESTETIVKDSRGSTETRHWSGRQDVQIKAPAVRVRSKER